ATTHSDRWDIAALLLIVAFTIISDLTSVDTGSTMIKVSGSFLGIMLAAVVLGGGPAAVAGVSPIAVGWVRFREKGYYLRNNIVTYAWFPLLGGLFFRATTQLAHVGPDDLGYYLLVFATFLVALVLNFIGVAGYQCYLDRTSLVRKSRDVVMPVLGAELF